MWTALKQAVVGILSSKKAVMGLTGALTAGIMKLGLNIDSETVGLVVGPIVTAILGMAAADHGKEAAQITANATKA